MNNLKHLKVRCLPVHDIKGEIIHISLGDDQKKRQIFYLQDGNLILIDFEKTEEIILCTEIHDVIRGEYIDCHNKISIFAKQNIYIIDCDTKEFYKHDFDEILQTSWSSAFDYLTIMFSTGVLKTYLFDASFELTDHGTGNINDVAPHQRSVGWGSAKTQFHGPAIPEEGVSTG